jgi:hypothetical protein
MCKTDGSYLRELAKIERQDGIILDDFGLLALDSRNLITLLEIIEDRHNNGSIIVTSQIPVKGWNDIIEEKTIADAILDRLIHQSHRLELYGESMRKKYYLVFESLWGKYGETKKTHKTLILNELWVFKVRVIGLEPTRLAAPDPKSGMSTNFTIPAKL